MDQSFDMFERGLDSLRSQFGNGEKSAVNNIPPNIGTTNNVFKLNLKRPAARQILARQGIIPRVSRVTPFTVFNRPSSTTPLPPTVPISFSSMVEIGKRNQVNSVDASGNISITPKITFRKTLDGGSSKVGITNILYACED